jgi:cystathionine beta-lyase/cystathionine gamma-synthase
MHSATKYLDGHGRVMGGAVVGSHALVEQVYLHVRTAGPTLAPFNAWVLLSGLETLSLRMEKHSANALELARWLEHIRRACLLSGPAQSSAACAGAASAEGGRCGGVVCG